MPAALDRFDCASRQASHFAISLSASLKTVLCEGLNIPNLPPFRATSLTKFSHQLRRDFTLH